MDEEHANMSVVADDQGLLSLDEVTHSVDTLVADSAPLYGIPRNVDWLGMASRSSTPTVPPGLMIPHLHSSPFMADNNLFNPPLRPTPPPGLPTPRQANTGLGQPITTPVMTPLITPAIPLATSQQPSFSKATDPLVTQTKESAKLSTSGTNLPKANSSNLAESQAHPSIQDEDFPALEPGGDKTEQTLTSVKTSIPSKTGQSTRGDSKPIVPTSVNDASQKPPSRRSTPRVLHATLPSSSIQVQSTAEANSQAALPQSAFPPLPPSAPPSTAQSPAPKSTPKMLRVVSTPKPEASGVTLATPLSATSPLPPGFPPSRQPSLASASRLERPGTPASENISDNASITSTSMSRASSPPPSKIGSAPVRTTTKSMQKKQRREAQKEKEKSVVDAVISKPEPGVEIAPIVGRKKKQKKEKANNSNASSRTPAVSRPATPGSTNTASTDIRTQTEASENPSTLPEKPPSPSKDTTKLAKTNDGKGKSKSKPKTPVASEPSPTVVEKPEEVPEPEKQITPAWALQQLVSSGFIKDPGSLGLLQPPTGVNHRHEFSGEVSQAAQKLTITQEDEAALLSGKAVHKVVDGTGRVLLTPSGNCVRNLTAEEEERYLELQSHLLKEPPAVTFTSAKDHASKGFTLVGGRAVPNGSTAFSPLSNGGSSQFDPVTKIHHDEALSYINQYVLPSLATPLQLEKALNSTSANAETNQPESTIWARWMNDAAATVSEHSDTASSMVNRADLLAAGWASMAAQFAIGTESEKNEAFGNVSLLSVEEAESAIQLARKETEVLEKKLNALIKKNRRLLLGSGH